MLDGLKSLKRGASLAMNLETMRKLLYSPREITMEGVQPWTEAAAAGSLDRKKKGDKLISEGKVGCILIAGGQGTRLGFDGPKGIYPLTSFKKKSLFQIFAEKVQAAGKKAGRELPLAIMTSRQNDAVTRSFFLENNFFGLNKEQIFFFEQGMLPLLDETGNTFLDQSGHTAYGPDGNGDCLKHFSLSGIAKKWQEMGIHYVLSILIDNPLSDPYDAELVAFHEESGGDLVVKCTNRLHSQEKMGVLAKKEGKMCVVEYSELPQKEMEACLPDHSLKYHLANITNFSFSMPFIEKAKEFDLPLHVAHKAGFWKFEKFIFDLLPLANAPQVIAYPREICYAPLKVASGDNGTEHVRMRLQAYEKILYTNISGLEPPHFPFELSMDFYYPTEEFTKKWRGKKIEKEGYIVD